MKSINPANSEVICEYTPHAKVEILNKINSTHEDFLLWKSVSIKDRSSFLSNLAI